MSRLEEDDLVKPCVVFAYGFITIERTGSILKAC